MTLYDYIKSKDHIWEQALFVFLRKPQFINGTVSAVPISCKQHGPHSYLCLKKFLLCIHAFSWSILGSVVVWLLWGVWRFSSLSSWQAAWQHAGRQGADGVAEGSTPRSEGIGKREWATWPGLTIWNLKAHLPVTGFLQQGHTSHKATPYESGGGDIFLQLTNPSVAGHLGWSLNLQGTYVCWEK